MTVFTDKTPDSGGGKHRQGLDWTERLESLKSGICGAVCAGLVFGILAWVNAHFMPPLATFMSLHSVDRPSFLLSAAIAIISGLLFGITYRYIIRLDQNPHLKSGAVLAFGLVRGLAQVEVSFHNQIDWLLWPLLVGESILLFAIVRLGLDWTLAREWIKPFPSTR